MERFSQLKYERPDVKSLKKEFGERVKRFKKAAAFEEANAELLGWNELQDRIVTMYSLSYIRHTVNMKDSFYDGETEFFDSALPKLMLILKKSAKPMLKSKFRPQLEQLYGTLMFKDTEIQSKLIKPSILLPSIRENKLSFKPCIFSRLYALVSQDSPLAGRKSITYQELLDWQLVLYTSEYAIHHTIVSELEKYGTPNILATVRNPQTIKRFVLQTNSVGFGPSISWDNDDDVHSGRIVPLLVEDSAPSQFGILYRKNSGPSVAGQKLMKEVQDYTERLTLNEGPEAGRSMK